MLDLSPMILLRHGRGLGAGSYGSGRCWTGSFLQMLNRFGFLLLVFSLSPLVWAQQSQGGFPSYYPNPGMGQQDLNSNSNPNANTWDCSDPLLGTSPECSGQGLEDLNSNQSFGAQSRMSPLTSYGQLRGTVPSYSDTESQRYQSSRYQNQPVVLPPEPLTEFQKFVASTTGQILPIFGANLFRRVPSTFAPLDNAPVPPDYIIGPGDELRIRIWGQVNFQANVRVDRSGEVYIPFWKRILEMRSDASIEILNCWLTSAKSVQSKFTSLGRHGVRAYIQ
jgi:hypothetical protein